MRRVGSPPRMRGKLFERYILGNWVRITPADAGKTYSARHGAGQNRDHPRGCGENALRTPRQQEQGGSPPRMRGKRIDAGQLIAVAGITPADAGKTFRLSPAKIAAEDHPRGCGENDIENRIFVKKEGSPPRMRGKPWVVAAPARQSRITPADAGKTSSKMTGTHSCRDHPRGCGENCHPLSRRNTASGSPPRMRGKHNADKASLEQQRITPADAGKTGSDSCRPDLRGDHPRGCGENYFVKPAALRAIGSPPRMRGKQSYTCIGGFRRGITPADAGKTGLGRRIKARTADHPRGCGENCIPCGYVRLV